MNIEELKIAKQKRKEYLSKTNFAEKVLIWLGIFQICYVPRNTKGLYWRCERFNPFNPLTYVMILCLIPTAACIGIWDFFKRLPKDFKVSKYG